MPNNDIRKIVREAVQETLASLGFDLRQINETQADLLYLRRLRKSSQGYDERIKIAVISVLIPAILYLLWVAVKSLIVGGK